VNDEGVAGEAAFYREDSADSASARGVGAETVDGFGGKGDKPSGAENFNGSFDLAMTVHQ
jgi:hypothetical protein